MEGMRVAYTLEQCWHRVPGGTAVAALEVARAMPEVRPDVTLLGVSGTHHEDPSITFDVSMDVAGLSLRSPWLYEASLRFNRPRVEKVWPDADLVHCTTLIPLATKRPMVATVHDVAFMHYPEFFTPRGNRVFRRSIAALKARAPRSCARRRQPSTICATSASAKSGCVTFHSACDRRTSRTMIVRACARSCLFRRSTCCSSARSSRARISSG
ncbi:MAG: hypothetical protein EBQ75_09845 [Actinobacteria bacterium]|nr:hypothetical protein [Actinomycetota bacterium]